MTSSLTQLLALIGDDSAYMQPAERLQALQREALNERFDQYVGSIALLRNRAESNGITKIRGVGDLVPLLFAHTAYKSYPESWIADNHWERMGRWLQTVSARPVTGLDVSDITDLDAWIQRLEQTGHYVTCSSGTTGKPALISCSKRDLEWSGTSSVSAMCWALGLEPRQDFRVMGVGGVSKAARASAIMKATVQAFSTEPLYMPGGMEVTIGQISKMISARRKVVEGVATPEEIAQFELIAQMRTQMLESITASTVEDYIASRDRKLLIGGMWGLLYPIAQGVQARGFGGKDFHPDNMLLIAGGLKGATLPPDYKTVIMETFNVRPDRFHQVYAMQEMNTSFPRCRAGRYHVPAWVQLLLLNESGDALLDTSAGGEIEGRAAFFDFSIDGRWGGVISGDKIKASYGRCACGSAGPSIDAEILRYSDLEAGDKLSCSGNMDAYMRGVA